MASLANRGGRRIIQFFGPDGKRKTLRLGLMSEKLSTRIKLRVEAINAANIAGEPPDEETARWIAKLDQKMLSKLAGVGLIQQRQPSQASLGEFIDSYVTGRKDVKKATALVYGHTRRNLIDFFGFNKPLREITAGNADSWRIWLATKERLADNTVRRRCGIAKQFFRAAVRRRLIVENPFADLVSAVRANNKRFHYVSREVAQRVIDACPDAQWRLLFALSRYGGLRCPSEHLALRWDDVNWALGRVTIHSSKTEHHEGGETRSIPIFPELLPYLTEVLRERPSGSEFVITRYRKNNTNLRTRLIKILEKAGLKPWPKLFQNLRSTRQTELAEQYPAHVVCEWIGNSLAIAKKHYLQVTDDHFREAAAPSVALQNALQQASAKTGDSSQEVREEPEEPVFCGLSRTLAMTHDDAVAYSVGGTGLEPVTSTVQVALDAFLP